MTKAVTGQQERGQGEPARCKQCRRVLPGQKTGRPREFCSQACRQWHWVGKQRAAELQLNETELIVAKDELDQLHDSLYVLACAVNDAERDLTALGGNLAAGAVREILDWLLEAARPLRDLELAPERPPSGSGAQRP